MSTLELKGDLIETIAKVDNKGLLARLYKVTLEMISEDTEQTDWADKLTEEAKRELQLAIDQSYDESNTVTHAEAVEHFRKWLK